MMPNFTLSVTNRLHDREGNVMRERKDQMKSETERPRNTHTKGPFQKTKEQFQKKKEISNCNPNNKNATFFPPSKRFSPLNLSQYKALKIPVRQQVPFRGKQLVSNAQSNA